MAKKMEVKVIDYTSELDLIEVSYHQGNNAPKTKAVPRRQWEMLLDEVKTQKRGINFAAEDEALLREINRNGGIKWLTEQANETIEL